MLVDYRRRRRKQNGDLCTWTKNEMRNANSRQNECCWANSNVHMMYRNLTHWTSSFIAAHEVLVFAHIESHVLLLVVLFRSLCRFQIRKVQQHCRCSSSSSIYRFWPAGPVWLLYDYTRLLLMYASMNIYIYDGWLTPFVHVADVHVSWETILQFMIVLHYIRKLHFVINNIALCKGLF